MRHIWLLAVAVAAACTGPAPTTADAPTVPATPSEGTSVPTVEEPSRADDPTTTPTATPATPTGAASTDTAAATETASVGTPVPLHVASRVDDVPTPAFRDEVAAILLDPRGWQRAGFAFTVVDDADAPYRVVLAEGHEVDELCLPMDTFGAYSCQNGPVVALNADRWRTATGSWEGSLADYRRMLVNHEVGHLLHLHHPSPQCPGPRLPAPVMAQQSSGAAPCTENPWPLQWEVDLAAEQAEPLAPPPSHDTSDHEPSPPAVTE